MGFAFQTLNRHLWCPCRLRLGMQRPPMEQQWHSFSCIVQTRCQYSHHMMTHNCRLAFVIIVILLRGECRTIALLCICCGLHIPPPPGMIPHFDSRTFQQTGRLHRPQLENVGYMGRWDSKMGLMNNPERFE